MSNHDNASQTTAPIIPTDRMLWHGFMVEERRDIPFDEFMALYPNWRADQIEIWQAMIKEWQAHD